jgi:hypothetical protein
MTNAAMVRNGYGEKLNDFKGGKLLAGYISYEARLKYEKLMCE